MAKKPKFNAALLRHILIFAAILTGLSGCGKAKTAETEATTAAVPETTKEIIVTTEAETESPSDAETETEASVYERAEKDGKIQSYLTGEMTDVKIANRRPIAIMMSNDKQAQPQYGINRAGVVYEAPVEGIMNRFMSIMEDYDDLERIGSCRSMRTYYTYFGKEYDAITVHYGQSTFALPYLKNNDDVNGIDNSGYPAFYRSKDKRSPHNAYTSGSRLNEIIAKLGYDQNYDPSYTGHFKFPVGNKEVKLDPAISLEGYYIIPGYGYNRPQFEYHEEDGLYYRYQYGQEHKGDEGQIKVKNIILQYAAIGHYSTTDYLDINIHADSYGYYITNGRAIPVSVKKDGEFGITHYYDMEGNEITMNVGKTWICIIDSKNFRDTLIEDKNQNRTNES